jgi:SNF2 family DNA or RNA helicase
MIKLANYGLNCALCDDMGLGKTIQSISVVLNESYSRILRNFPDLGIE